MAAKKKRGRKGGDVVVVVKRLCRTYRFYGEWQWTRYSSNSEYICGSWPETFKRRIDCLKSAKRAMTVCPIEIEK